ncbi:MAG TPA: porin [Thermoanaerobaculia bacterium]|nr:porin [Thermoanaerobaculia bacterium]
MKIRVALAAALSGFVAAAAFAQVTPAAGFTPPDDSPSFKVGVTIYGDYTYQESPQIIDADGNPVKMSSFNVSRAYINMTGNLSHRISYRITPDIARETSTGASLSGSQELRLKYAFAQLALDDWTTHGSFIRFGVQQTPFVDYTEGIYRYRWQGTTFPERVGLISSSDAGLSGRWAFPGNYGDVHAGYYNGENYNKAEVNNEKGFEIRGTVRPFPLGGTMLKGLRITGFAVQDHYVESAKRQRYIGQVTYEHPVVNAGFDVLTAKDQTSITKPEADSKGWSFWVTPKIGTKGWEVLLRHDNFTPNKSFSTQQTKRNIAGLAYWIPNLQRVTAAVMADYDSLKSDNFTPARADDTRYGLKMLINF